MVERFEDVDIDIDTYRRALRALSTYRYVVLSASNQLVDTDHVLDGDVVLSDRDGEHEHVFKDSANPYRLSKRNPATQHVDFHHEIVVQDPRRIFGVEEESDHQLEGTE